MDKFPILQEGRSIGELTAERNQSGTCFAARCRSPGSGLWTLWLVGTEGEFRLGIPAAEENRMTLRRQFSCRATESVGTFLRGELRPAEAGRGAGELQWQSFSGQRLHTPWLRRQTEALNGVLFRRRERRLSLAIPAEVEKPFPLPRLFCFARLMVICGKPYWVFHFCENENPCF